MSKVKKYLAYDGKVSVICVDTKDIVEELRKIHDLTPTTTAVLGRFVTVSGMMGHVSMKENDDIITCQIKADGPVGTICSVVRRNDNVSKVKAYMQNPHVELPLREDGKINVGGAVGKYGFLNVIKKNAMTDGEYTGVVPLVSGEIAEDFAQYFVTSEQKPTVLALGVLLDKNGVRAAGGYIINLMPDATEENIESIESAISVAPSISSLLEQEKSLDEISKIITGDENIRLIEEDLEIVLECDCSKEKFRDGIASLGRDTIKEIIEEDQKAEVKCQFCNKKYEFSKEDLEELLNNTKE